MNTKLTASAGIPAITPSEVLFRLVTIGGTRVGERLGEKMNSAIDAFVDAIFKSNSKNQ